MSAFNECLVGLSSIFKQYGIVFSATPGSGHIEPLKSGAISLGYINQVSALSFEFIYGKDLLSPLISCINWVLRHFVKNDTV